MASEREDSATAGSRSWLGILLVVLATVFWSTSGIFISFILRGTDMAPVGLAFWRDLGTFICLFIGLAIFAPNLLRVKRKDLPWLIAMGALSIGFFHVLWNTSIMLNGVGIATVIQSTAPLFVTIAAWRLWKETLSLAKIIAIALAGTGVYLIARPESWGNVEITLFGVFIGLLSAIFYGSFSLFGKRLTGDYNPWTILVYVFGVATLVLLPFQFTQPIPWPVSSQLVLSFIALILLTTISGFALYTAGLQRLPASVASITSNTEVPFAAILAYLILGERMSPVQIFGTLMVIIGVILVSIPRARRKSSRSEAVQQETTISMD
jgi:drug/metabolite transporter (DMT)-like permease